MRARGAWILLVAALALGCPGGKGATPGPADPAGGTGAGSETATSPEPPLDGGAAPTTGGGRDPIEVAAGPLTGDECRALADKVIAVGLAEQHARDPKAKQATPEQQAAIRDRLLEQMTPACAVMSRASYGCAMSAADRAAMLACEK